MNDRDRAIAAQAAETLRLAALSLPPCATLRLTQTTDAEGHLREPDIVIEYRPQAVESGRL